MKVMKLMKLWQSRFVAIVFFATGFFGCLFYVMLLHDHVWQPLPRGSIDDIVTIDQFLPCRTSADIVRLFVSVLTMYVGWRIWKLRGVNRNGVFLMIGIAWYWISFMNWRDRFYRSANWLEPPTFLSVVPEFVVPLAPLALLLAFHCCCRSKFDRARDQPVQREP